MIGGFEMSEKISKAQANYRASVNKDRDCGNCNMFVPPKKKQKQDRVLGESYGGCTLVKGAIFEDDVCDYWEKKT